MKEKRVQKFMLSLVLAGSLSLAHGEEGKVLYGGGYGESPTVMAQLQGNQVTLQFKRSGMELSGQAGADGLFRIQGRRWRYELTPMGDGTYQLVEYALPKNEKTWSMIMSSDGSGGVEHVQQAPQVVKEPEKKAALPVPSVPVKVGEVWQGEGGKGGVFVATFVQEGVEIVFPANKTRYMAEADGKGGYYLKGKRFHYAFQYVDGSWRLVEFNLNGQPTGWQVVMSKKEAGLPVEPPVVKEEVVVVPVLEKPEKVEKEEVKEVQTFTATADNGTRVVLKQEAGGMSLAFPALGVQLTGEKKEGGEVRFQGKRFVYLAAPQREGGWLVREYGLKNESATGWQVKMPSGKEPLLPVEPPQESQQPLVVDSPPPPPAQEPPKESMVDVGEKVSQTFTAVAANGTKVVLRQEAGGMSLAFPALGVRLVGEKREGGEVRFQGKRFVYVAVPQREGGWLVREYGLKNESATGWQVTFSSEKELAQSPAPVAPPPEPVAPAPPSPALLSQVHGKAVSRETILTGMGGNGTKVVLKQVDGGMVLSFPGKGIQLKGELLADGNYRFQGKRYVYITAAHGAGGLLLREFYLDGEKTTGWSAHATEASSLPATFPTAGYGKRPAFTTNAYFSDKLITVDGYLQPNAVINVLPSDRPGELGFLVLDMILVKGIHHFSVVIRGEGEKQPGDMRFEAVEADQDGTIYTAVGVIEGPLPSGWLTFRVVDRLNDRDASDVGVYRILAKELPQVEESGHSEPLLGNPPQ